MFGLAYFLSSDLCLKSSFMAYNIKANKLILSNWVDLLQKITKREEKSLNKLEKMGYLV